MDRPVSLESRRIDLAVEPAFQLGRARIDPPAHEISIGLKSARMQPQTLKVLIALHDKSGHAVTREELADRCWDSRVVGEDVVNRCISLLRRVAAKSGGFEIETIPRGGYRLNENHTFGRPKLAWIGVAAMITVAVAGMLLWAWPMRAPVRQGVPPAPVVTVVPFSTDSNDPVERQIAKAAPVSISHMLSESGLPIVVADSGSSAAKGDFVISGNVHRSGDSIRTTVQMNGVRDGTMAFSHDFESTAAQSANLPDQIGALLAAELAWTGAEMVLDRRKPLDPQIASELMKAMGLTIENGDSLRAYQIDRRIAPMAPNSAIAQLTFAVDTGFSISSIPRAQRDEAVAMGRRASQRALALAPEFGDVYITWCLLHSPVRMIQCDARMRSAMRIDPSSSFVPGYLSSLLYDAGRIDESVELARVSLANDPYKPAKMARMIRMLEVSGKADEADSTYREATRLWPDNRRIRSGRMAGMAEAGNYDGIQRFANAGSDGGMFDAAPVEALIAAEHRHDLAQARRACRASNLKRFTRTLCTTILADLGDPDGSFAIAATLYPAWKALPGADEDRVWLDDPDGFETAILSAPAGKAMRADPRFLAIADKLGLLAYWRTTRLPDFCTGGHEPVCARIEPQRTAS